MAALSVITVFNNVFLSFYTGYIQSAIFNPPDNIHTAYSLTNNYVVDKDDLLADLNLTSLFIHLWGLMEYEILYQLVVFPLSFMYTQCLIHFMGLFEDSPVDPPALIFMSYRFVTFVFHYMGLG